jgi:hypothetical protein
MVADVTNSVPSVQKGVDHPDATPEYEKLSDNV